MYLCFGGSCVHLHHKHRASGALARNVFLTSPKSFWQTKKSIIINYKWLNSRQPPTLAAVSPSAGLFWHGPMVCGAASARLSGSQGMVVALSVSAPITCWILVLELSKSDTKYPFFHSLAFQNFQPPLNVFIEEYTNLALHYTTLSDLWWKKKKITTIFALEPKVSPFFSRHSSSLSKPHAYVTYHVTPLWTVQLEIQVVLW